MGAIQRMQKLGQLDSWTLAWPIYYIGIRFKYLWNG